MDEKAANAAQSQTQRPRRHQVAAACIRCRKRKIRCNGRFPCETCLRLRLNCQEPEIKRNPSRASLERRIEQLETLASEAGIDLFSIKSQHEVSGEQTSVGRHRSVSTASAGSNLSLPQPLRPEATQLLAPSSGAKGYATSVPASAATSPLNIPMIEVTTSSRTQSPEPSGNVHAVTGCHTPDLATPALSTGSLSIPPSPAVTSPLLEPWYLPQEHDSSVESQLSFEHDRFTLSPCSSMSSHVSPTLQQPPTGMMLDSDGQLNKQPVAPSNYLSVSSLADLSPASYYQDQLATFSPVASPLQVPQVPQNMYGGISAISPASGQWTTPFTNEASSVADVNYAFTEDYANLCSSAYFQHIHPFYPFLDRETYLKYLAVVYNSYGQSKQSLDIPLTTAGFQVYIVQAIGARILELQGAVQKSFRGSYFSAAMVSQNTFHRLETLEDVHSAMLLLLYAFHSGAPDIEPLTLKATITSSCVQLGLHKPKSSLTPLAHKASSELRTFLSAYVLDRKISLALDQPLSLCDDDIEIETLISQLERHQAPQARSTSASSGSSSTKKTHTNHAPGPAPAPLAVLTTTAKLYRPISTIHTVYSYFRPNPHGIPRLSTPFLTNPTPPTLSTWRGEMFRTLEGLSAEFQRTRAAQTASPSTGRQRGRQQLHNDNDDSDASLDSVNDTVELLINEGILSLLHPPSRAGDLNPFEVRTVHSTARATASIYRRLQGAKALIPSAHHARGVYLTCMALAECSNTQSNSSGVPLEGRSKKSKKSGAGAGVAAGVAAGTDGDVVRSNDPDISLCRDILRWLSDEGVDVAVTLAGKLEER